MVQIARPCDKHVVCPVIEGLFFPDPDSPYANLSSEKPEPAPSPYCILHPASPLCHNPPPPVPDGCRNCCPPNIDCRIIPIPDGSCTGRNCGSDGGVVIGQDGDGNQTMPFYNTAQSCTVECPDGSSFTHTIAAGRFTSTFSQQEADANAASYCEDEANSLMICIITDTLPSACVGDLYGEQIVAEGGVPRATGNAYLWSASGLPPGLDINTVRGNIGGTPTTPGNYSVTVTATDGLNNSRTKTFTLIIGGISNSATLPTAYETDNYSVQLNGAPSSTYVADGIWPHWLSINSSGLITGSPDIGDAGNYTITVIQTTGTQVCSKTFTIQVWQRIHFETVNANPGSFDVGPDYVNNITAPLTPPFSGNWIAAHYELVYVTGAYGVSCSAFPNEYNCFTTGNTDGNCKGGTALSVVAPVVALVKGYTANGTPLNPALQSDPVIPTRGLNPVCSFDLGSSSPVITLQWNRFYTGLTVCSIAGVDATQFGSCTYTLKVFVSP